MACDHSGPHFTSIPSGSTWYYMLPSFTLGFLEPPSPHYCLDSASRASTLRRPHDHRGCLPHYPSLLIPRFLSLCGLYPDETEDKAPVADPRFPRSAPHLTCALCMKNSSPRAPLGVLWRQFTTLRLDSSSIPAYKCLDIIPSCTLLQECDIFLLLIDNLVRERIVELYHPQTILPYLHMLYVEFFNSENSNSAFLRHALHLRIF
ncbi:hypothetical protein BD779DRAFT_1147614 [Infundibulicybe gibba]|nr:hypothetical protein BD779DRAFT_1147614 [Infundibulicybe gibba]